MRKFKELVKDNVPGAKHLWRWLYWAYRRSQSKKTRQVFTRKYHVNEWGSTESVSGVGSELVQTQILLNRLPELLSKYQIKTFLDLPCGDMNWMSKLEYSFERYTGADIVPELIESNRCKFASMGEFKILNLLKDPLPRVDVIFCRDCLVHLSFRDVKLALANIKRSGSTYLLTTTFPKHPTNVDILTGDWRYLNLQADPIKLPHPVEIIAERVNDTTESGDKSLGMWLIEQM